MVLNKVRNAIQPLMDALGRGLGGLGLSPSFWTFLGFLFSVLAGFLYAWRPQQPYLAALLIVASGVMDVLDGAVARATGRVSKTGSFNDSTLDRVSEVAIYSGIAYASYTSSLVVILTLGFSLLVSYARAKGDSLNVTLTGVGIGERAERLIVLIAFSLAGYVAYGVYIVLALAIVTFLQRYFYIVGHLRPSHS